MKPGKRSNKYPSFVALPREMLKLPEWRSGLSSSGKVLYVHLKHKYTGQNNGDICLHYSEVEDFMAPATIARAFRELEAKEWIVVERTVGGKHRFTTHYSLTGKYDKSILWFKK